MRVLRDDDNGVLPDLYLEPEHGFYISRFEPGFPTVHDDTLERTQASGIHDYTEFYGEAVVNIEGMIVPRNGVSRQSLIDRLAQYCHPARRVYLHWQLNDDDEARCIRIRGRGLNRPIEAWNRRNFQAQWIAARGVQESSRQYRVSVPMLEEIELPGRDYDPEGDGERDYPRVYPEAGSTGQSDVYNGGNETAWPIIRLVGGVINPTITNVTTGNSYSFELTIPVGAYLEIDTAENLILMNGDFNDSRYDTLSDPTGEWWGLEPGSNLMTYTAASVTGGTPVAEVIYRYAYL